MQNFLFFLILGAVGFVCIWKSREIVRLMGRSVWAEGKFGPGGSETMWKILGIILIVFGVFLVTGITNVLVAILRSFIRPGS